ncbi:hypothetical protein ALC57_02995 [Trachymyrmex cornetzi]|uniref:Reverse transcriptase domain-containing protein n=1 Tax=Trachymyrmex cornetzi TaxID=471704 RepID=A0A151JN24_9HYME|nr:hypothetical protein ALC57_02995 [Trachymyrmex cornetzi]
MKKAASVQKSSREIVRPQLPVSRRIQQPISQPLRVAASKSGNARAPASHSRATSRRSGASASRHLYRASRSRGGVKLREEAISGYRLPFTQQPPSQVSEPSAHLSDLEEQLCSQEISRLLNMEAIEPAVDSDLQFLSSFFIIKKSSGGCRFILNLKNLNRFITAPHFKLEDWKTVIRLISPGDYLASIDLRDAYFLIPVHQNDRKYLRFHFRGVLFQFRVLLFSLASAYIFTKVL